MDQRAFARRATFEVEPPGALEDLASLKAWGRAVVLVKDAGGYSVLCRLLCALHHGGDGPPLDCPEERAEAVKQLRVTERVAGYTLHRSEGAAGATRPEAPSQFQRSPQPGAVSSA